MRRTLLVVTAVLLVLMLSFAVTGCRKSSENKGGGGYLPAPRSAELTAVAYVSRRQPPLTVSTPPGSKSDASRDRILSPGTQGLV